VRRQGKVTAKGNLRWRFGAPMAALIVMLAPGLAWAGGRSARFRIETALLVQEITQLTRGDRAPRLKERIQSDLGVLAFEARSYAEEQRAGHRKALLEVRAAKRAFVEHDYVRLLGVMRGLHHTYPVHFHGILPLSPTHARMAYGRFLYQNLCATCHIAGVSNTPVPDLFSMARTQSPADLVVQIMSGVRGTRAVAFANPLTYGQIASLASFLRYSNPRILHHAR